MFDKQFFKKQFNFDLKTKAKYKIHPLKKFLKLSKRKTMSNGMLYKL